MNTRQWTTAVVAMMAMAVSDATARSINVDFTSTGSVPSDSYAAAGTAGRWNAVPVLPAAERLSLVDLDGNASPVKIYQIGGSAMLDTDDASTSGDHEALLDDMFLSFNDPLDECVWFEGLDNGDYRVLIYALTPNDAGLLSRVRVDFATPGPTWIGGAWPGTHIDGVSYQSFDVSVTDGKIGLHSGVVSGLIQSGINGIQLVDLTASTSVGLGAEASSTGILDVFPNPARGSQTIRLANRDVTTLGVEILDVRGRLVVRGQAIGSPEFVWDGRDAAGRLVPPAVYFVRVPGIAGVRKITRID
jgi:hypothetical protein